MKLLLLPALAVLIYWGLIKNLEKEARDAGKPAAARERV